MTSKEYHEYYTRRKQEKGTLDGFNVDNWEEIPDEDLWQDGELISVAEVMLVIEKEVFFTGKWKLIRRIEDDE